MQQQMDSLISQPAHTVFLLAVDAKRALVYALGEKKDPFPHLEGYEVYNAGPILIQPN